MYSLHNTQFVPYDSVDFQITTELGERDTITELLSGEYT